MADETYVNAPGVQADAQKLAEAVRRFQRSLDELKAALQADDKCWSDDEIGAEFEKNYKSAAGKVTDSLEQTGKNLLQVAEKTLPDSARVLQEQDDFNAQGVRAAAAELYQETPPDTKS
ncbi:hypothetical protein [Saccharopolyspora elongata]|uniref:WXG100 family type VII secretion target n=1 Tax=Saccharopolyspora elongata TaxID=2530387 RepID=A0A4R4YG57_9PSEU|nr:hypothetical protein [Saccharopolyspora elongata]TDD42212.1 hypothetical protein E1288_30255 [Saccharopolyspora elongata]